MSWVNARVKVKSLSHVRLFVTPWTVADQAPQSMEFSRQEYWSGLPFPSPGDPPDPGIEPGSPALQADALPSEPPGKAVVDISLSIMIISSCMFVAANGIGMKVLVTQSCPTLCDPWTVACQAPQSMEFSRQEYWSELPFPSPEDLPNPGIKPGSPALQVDSLPFEPPSKS